jgi:hypothetical protein
MRSNVAKTVGGLIAVLMLGALSAAPAFASGKPLVETKAATKVAENEATLNAVVNPNGASTKYHFEYWWNASEKLKTAEVSAGSGTSNVEATAALTGLKAEKLYHFRIIASNTNGTSEGALVEFSTTGGPLPEFKKIVNNKKFTLTGGETHFRVVSGVNWGCGGTSAEGELTGAKTATIAFRFGDCGVSGGKCTTEGDESGEITTGSLPAQLVYLSKEKREVGLVVNYHETNFAAWHCPGVSGGIHGSIIVPITPVNKATKSFAMDFAGKEGIQQPTSFEGAEEKMFASPTMALISEIYQEGSMEASTSLATKLEAEIAA